MRDFDHPRIYGNSENHMKLSNFPLYIFRFFSFKDTYTDSIIRDYLLHKINYTLKTTLYCTFSVDVFVPNDSKQFNH